jgi:tetratricopeptide (TPR) repeat protein
MGRTSNDLLLMKALAEIGANTSALSRERFSALMLYASRSTPQEAFVASSNALALAENSVEKAEASLCMARYAPSAGVRKEQVPGMLEPVLSSLDALPRELQRSVLLALASSYVNLGRTRDAIKTYETVLGRDLPESPEAAYKLLWEIASLRVKDGQIDESVDAARKALTGYPEVNLDTKVSDIGAVGLRWMSAGQVEESIRLLRLGPQVLSNAPPNAIVRMEIPLHIALAVEALSAKPPDMTGAEKEYLQWCSFFPSWAGTPRPFRKPRSSSMPATRGASASPPIRSSANSRRWTSIWAGRIAS